MTSGNTNANDNEANKMLQRTKAINAKLNAINFYGGEPFNADQIRAGARFVLEELAEKGKVCYSEYYDGTKKKHSFLRKRIQADDVDKKCFHR